jgi:tryptophan synthase alpha chain
MNRIDRVFAELKTKREGALLCYLPAIGPDFSRSMQVIDAYVQGGMDILELSTPGGAPWLDGPPMQAHHKQSHETGVDTLKAFELAKMVRERYPDLPILPMVYHAAVVRQGVDKFIDLCKEAHVDGVELPDYPSYSAGDPHKVDAKLRAAGIHNIAFCDGISLAPEGSQPYQLLHAIITGASGFMWLTATPGVTGGQGEVAVEYLTRAVKRIRAVQSSVGRPTPILVGFGLTTPTHVHQVVHDVGADAVVVGSAISRLINRGEAAEEIRKFVAQLKQATRDTPDERRTRAN